MSNSYSNDSVHGLQNPQKGKLEAKEGGGIKEPESILLTVQVARHIYQGLRTGQLKRAQFMAAIDGLIAGKPPYDPQELEEAGLDYVANVNMMDAEALYSRSCQAYSNLTFLSTNHFVVGYRAQSDRDAEISEILSRNLHLVVNSWKSYPKLKAQNSAQIVKYGMSTIIWPDERSWKWRVIDTDKFYVPDQTQADVEQITAVCVDTDMTIQKLFQIYTQFKNEKDNKDNPWNINELEHLLLRLSGVDDKAQSGPINIADVERKFYAGDSSVGCKYSDSISLVSFLQVEYDLTVTQLMFHPMMDQGKFLYKVKGQYKTLSDALLIYTSSPGEKTLHANRGTGHRIFTSSQAIMRLDNSVLDSARIASTPMLQGSPTSSQDPQGIRLYPGVVTFIGMNKFEQNNFGQSINQLVGASQYFTGKQSGNLGNSGDDPAFPDKSQGSISAEQFKAKKLSEFAILKNNIAHYYQTEDSLVENIVGKMLYMTSTDPDYEYVKRWKELCIEEGVPEEIFEVNKRKDDDIWVLPKRWYARHTRVTGDGSSVNAIMSLEQFAGLAGGSMTAEGVDFFNREVAIHTVGVDKVKPLLGNKTADAQSSGATIAGLENNNMLDGKMPIFSPDNPHRGHFVTHAALASDTIQRIQQQEIDAIAADNIMNALVPHTEEHFMALTKNMFDRKFAEEQQKNWDQIKKWAGENRSNAARIKQAQLKQKIADEQGTEQAMTDAERKDFVAKSDEERKNFTLQKKEERNNAAEQVRGQVMVNKTVGAARNQRLSILLKDKNDVAAASLEHLRENIKNSNGKTPAPNDLETD